MKQRLSIIGKGTVGCLSALKFYNQGHDIDWYHDPNTPALSVGEGTDLALPNFLTEELNLDYDKIKNLNANYKEGIEKIGWTPEPFTHWFGLSNMALHINAHKLQNYIVDHLKDKINIIEKKVKHSDLNTYIIDCSGKTPTPDEYNNTPIPVNEAYVVNCSWDKPRFNKTLCIAKSYGWVFLVPLQDRCSVGYLYNKNYATLEEIKYETKNILKQYHLVADIEKIIGFQNYYRKINFSENISYNGNASFFLEPLEATSLNTAIRVINQTNKILSDGGLDFQNNTYKNFLTETIDIIMLHYLVDPPVKNLFWEYANNKAKSWLSDRFKTYPKIRLITEDSSLRYSTWFENSFKQNIKGLKLYNKLKEFTW